MLTSYRYAVVCLLVGCIPPPGSYQQQQGAYPAQGGSRSQSPSNGANDDEAAAWDGEREAAEGEREAAEREREATEGARGQAPTPRRDGRSAPKRGRAPASSGRADGASNANWWLCTAEASLGTSQGSGPVSYRTQSALGNGPTRDDASLAALKDCNSLVGFYKSLAWGSGETVEGGTCTIVNCTVGQR
jgi:hypothetical protein